MSNIRWIKEADERLLFNSDSGRIRASLWADADGKIYPTLFVTPCELFALLRNNELVSITWVAPLTFRVTLIRHKVTGDVIERVGHDKALDAVFDHAADEIEDMLN